jgi:hypothetical protein
MWRRRPITLRVWVEVRPDSPREVILDLPGPRLRPLLRLVSIVCTMRSCLLFVGLPHFYCKFGVYCTDKGLNIVFV